MMGWRVCLRVSRSTLSLSRSFRHAFAPSLRMFAVRFFKFEPRAAQQKYSCSFFCLLLLLRLPFPLALTTSFSDRFGRGFFYFRGKLAVRRLLQLLLCMHIVMSQPIRFLKAYRSKVPVQLDVKFSSVCRALAFCLRT